MRNASGHNYRNSSFIVGLVIGQIPRSTKCIFSFCNDVSQLLHLLKSADKISL